MTQFRLLRTNFKITIRTDFAISLYSPLYMSKKFLPTNCQWEESAFGQLFALTSSVASIQNKTKFSFFNLAFLLAFEQWIARSHFWHLSRLHSFAFVNNTAMNIGVYISFLFTLFFFFRKMSNKGIVGSYGSYIFNWGISILAKPIYSPTNSLWMFSFSHILASTCYLFLFW